jgi:subtilisin-like proprotein convertase family protein
VEEEAMAAQCVRRVVLVAGVLLILGVGVVSSAEGVSPYRVVEVAPAPGEEAGKAPSDAAKVLSAIPDADLKSVSGPITVREAEPNGSPAEATAIGGASAVAYGTVYPNGDLDYFSFAGAAGDRVYAAVQTSHSANGSTDSYLTLFDSDGTTVIEFDNDDGSFGSLSSSIAGATLPANGTYYIQARHSSATNQLRPYNLYFRLQSGLPTAETEPNDTGQALPAGGWVSGDTSAVTDVDIFTFDLSAGDTVFLSLDLDPERDAAEWNGTVGLGPFNGFVLIVNDAGSSSPDSEAFFMTVKDAGTYYAYVTVPSGGTTFGTYHLSATVFPASNDGLACTTYTSTDVPQTIPDGPGLVTSTITIPGNPRIADLDVAIDLTHLNMPDLDVNLVSPQGNDNGLFNDIGSSSQTPMNLVVDDEGAIPIGAYTVVSGMVYQPEYNYRLSWFDGEDAGGTWTLTLRDDAAANGGTLNGWSITVCEPAPPPQCPPGYAPVTVYASDFEANDGGFTHSGTQDEWQWGTPSYVPITTCASGTNCWVTDLVGTYNASSNQDLVSPVIDLTGLSAPVLVSWSQRYQMESASYDHATVDFRWADDSNPTRLFEWLGATMTVSVGSPSTTIQESAGWGLFTADMSSYAGQQTELVFHVDTDSSVNYAGLAIDDVAVTACEPSMAAAISLTKTVGTAPGVCATTDNISVTVGTTVYYCYEVTNIGSVPLDLHDLVDDQLGTIFGGFAYALAPGSSVNTVDAGLTVSAVINTTTTNSATWTAYNAGPVDVATATDTATVTAVLPPDIDVTPTSLAAVQGPNTTTQQTLTIGNFGESDLIWDLFEEPSGVQTPLKVRVEPAPVQPVDPEIAVADEMSGRDEAPPKDLGEPDPAAAARARALLQVVGLLLIPDSTNDRVMAFDPITGNVVDPDFIPSDPTNLSTPKSAILSAGGTSVLVSDQVDDVVQEYDLAGNYIGVFAPAGGVNTSILDNILGIDLRANGNLLVPVDSGANQDSVAEFDTGGNYLGNFIAIGAGGLDGGFDVWPLGSDWLVTSINSDNVLRYDSTGAPLGVFAAAVSFGEQINGAGNGNVLVANFSTPNSGVMEFTPAGALVGVYAPVTGNRGVYELPNGNILTTNGSGVHEIDRLGNLVETKFAVTGAQYIEYVAPQSDCTNLADVPWLSTSPVSGTTPPAGSTPVAVTFDSTGLLGGLYNANLCALSNDPDEPVVAIPVTLEVVGGPVAAITLAKTVGTVDGVCATTDTITVTSGSTVYYCYEVTNVGDLTLDVHDLVDDQLGPIFSGLSYALAPGSSVNTVTAGLSISTVVTATTTNTATWTASVVGGPTAEATDTATVNVVDPDITVAPASLFSSQLTNATVVQQLTVGNVGAGELLWNINEAAPPAATQFPPMPVPAGPGDVTVAEELIGAVPDFIVPTDPRAVLPAWERPQAVLYDNGPLVTHPAGGAGGADASALQTALGMGTYGFGHQVSAGNRVADDFTIAGGNWVIETITLFAYQTGSSTTSTINAVNLQIWDGPPDNPASTVVWGDTTTNIMTSTTWSNIYRVLDTALLDTARPIMASTVAVNTTLPPGTYWLDWQSGGTLASGPWAPPVSILGQTTTGNAKQYTSTGWADLVDVGPQGLPFIIEGTSSNCYSPSDIPWLSVSPAAGTTPPSGSSTVDVTFDSTGIAVGNYDALLCVFSNDPDEPLVEVPVQMEVVIPVELMGFSVE